MSDDELTSTTTASNTVKCAGCQSELNANTTEHVKTSLNELYHVHCLTCDQCNSRLVGEFALDHDNKPLCANCRKNCSVCGKNLSGQYLALSDGRVVHHGCAPVRQCDACGKKIDAGNKHLVAKERVFCAGCLQCDSCKAKIDSFAEIPSSSILCVPCASASPAAASASVTVTTTSSSSDGDGGHSGHGGSDGGGESEKLSRKYDCEGCHSQIGVGKFVHCLDKQYHPQCLKCSVCAVALGAGVEIFNRDGKPACETCGKYKE